MATIKRVIKRDISHYCTDLFELVIIFDLSGHELQETLVYRGVARGGQGV